MFMINVSPFFCCGWSSCGSSLGWCSVFFYVRVWKQKYENVLYALTIVSHLRASAKWLTFKWVLIWQSGTLSSIHHWTHTALVNNGPQCAMLQPQMACPICYIGGNQYFVFHSVALKCPISGRSKCICKTCHWRYEKIHLVSPSSQISHQCLSKYLLALTCTAGQAAAAQSTGDFTWKLSDSECHSQT